MTVHVALFLSSEGIALAHRQSAGHWAFLGDTSFAAPDLDAAMEKLRDEAEKREGEKFAALLILPDDQILYTSLTAPTVDPETTADRIEEGLEGLTPYAVSELLYDWRALEADRVKLAVVAQETLDEARSFAKAHGFNAAGFAAMPPQERFPGVPLFDLLPEAHGLSFPEEGIAFGPDTWPEEQNTDEPAEEAASGSEADTEADRRDKTAPVADEAKTSKGIGTGEDGDAEDTAPADTEAGSTTQDDDEGADEPAGDKSAKDGGGARRKSARSKAKDRAAAAAVAGEAASQDAGAGPADMVDAETAKNAPVAGAPQTEEATTPPPDAGELDTGDPAGGRKAGAEKPAADAPGEKGGTEAEAKDASAKGPSQDAKDASSDPDDDAGELDPEEVIAAAAVRDETRMAPDPVAKAADPAPSDQDDAPQADEARDDAPSAIADPALTGPVQPLREDEQEDDELPDKPSSAVLAARKASAAFAGASPAPEFSARRDRVPARDNDAQGEERPADGAESGQSGPSAGEAGTAAESSPEAASRNSLVERLSRARSAEDAKSADEDADDRALRPAPRRNDGKSARPVLPPSGLRPGDPAEADTPRRGRLSGLAAPKGPTGSSADVTEDGPGFGGRISEFLSRSKPRGPASKPRVAATPSQGATGTGRLTALGTALNTPEPGHAAAAKDDVAAEAETPPVRRGDDEDANITGGLLGRKNEDASGRSFGTGLLLTVILLILLAAIAVWSALFLPDSPVARLIGSGEEASDTGPLEARAPPEAIVAPPAIGELADVGTPPSRVLDEAETAVAPAIEDEAAADGVEIAALPAEAEAPAAAPAEPDAAEPDIAAAPRVPDLAPLPQEGLPSLEETRAAFEEFGIWQRPPERPDLAPLDTLSDLAMSSSDPSVGSLDAVSLVPPAIDPGETLRRVPSPPPFGSAPRRTAAGLVAATPEGVVTPDGVLVTAGPPPVTAIPRPREVALPAPAPSFSIEDAILGTFRPSPRPDDLSAIEAPDLPNEPPAARASLLPQAREAPASDASSASLFVNSDGTAEAAAPVAIEDASALAVAASLVPATRPSNMETLVANAVRRTPEPPPATVEPAAIAPGPSIPSSADVARAATQRNELRLRDVNLIGVTGTPSERRALVRLPSGRFVRVGVGDRLDGGRVAAIGETTLQYVRGGRTLTLDIPG